MNFLDNLSSTIADSLNDDELSLLFSHFDKEYKKLGKQEKELTIFKCLVDLKKQKRIHEVIETCNVIHPNINWQNDFSENSLNKPSLEDKREAFIRLLFDEKPVALLPVIIKGWEFKVTELCYKVAPTFTQKQVTSLSRLFSSLTYHYQIEQPFLNYHSIRLWYSNLRLIIKTVLSPVIALVLASVVSIPIATLFALLVVILETDNAATLVYEVSETGTYFIEVNNLEPTENEYFLYAAESELTSLEPNFLRTSFQSISYGQYVFGQLAYPFSHLYRIEGEVNQGIVVYFDPWYADAILQLSLLDSDMRQCDSVNLGEIQFGNSLGLLDCGGATDGPYYLKIEVDRSFSGYDLAASHYGFQVLRVENESGEPNDVFSSSEKILTGTFVMGNLDANDKDIYSIDLSEGQQVFIQVSGSYNMPTPSLVMYSQNGRQYEIIGYGGTTLPEALGIRRIERMLKTSLGRALLVSLIFDIIGINVDPMSLVPDYWLAILPGLTLAILLVAYALYQTLLSEQHFEESKLVYRTVCLLEILDTDDILISEQNKSKVRGKIELISEHLLRIPRASAYPFFPAPYAMREKLELIASQVAQTTNIVSCPDQSSLFELRRRFESWLNIFIKTYYGEFPFTEEFEYTPIPFHKQILYAFQFNSKKITLIFLAVAIALYVSKSVWQDYTLRLMAWGWLALRYFLLTISVYIIYERWGVKEPGTEIKSKWQNAVKLILFFFIPFIALDALLGTGVIENVIKLLGSLKIF